MRIIAKFFFSSTRPNQYIVFRTIEFYSQFHESNSISRFTIALHICLLVATVVHMELARRLVRIFPKMVNDIYIGDEYYGEGPLHIALVNEDPQMVKVYNRLTSTNTRIYTHVHSRAVST